MEKVFPQYSPATKKAQLKSCASVYFDREVLQSELSCKQVRENTQQNN